MRRQNPQGPPRGHPLRESLRQVRRAAGKGRLKELAMRAVSANRYAVFFAIVVAGCAADLLTKQWIFDWLGSPVGQTWWIWPRVVGIQTTLNDGALFGMGPGMAPVFAVLSVVAAIGIFWWLFFA